MGNLPRGLYIVLIVALGALAARADGGLPAEPVVMRDRRHLDREAELGNGDVVSVTDSPMPEG